MAVLDITRYQIHTNLHPSFWRNQSLNSITQMTLITSMELPTASRKMLKITIFESFLIETSDMYKLLYYRISYSSFETFSFP